MKILASISAAVVLLSVALAASGYDGAGGIELRRGLSARAIAMGETGLVPGSGPTTFAANPALLPWTTSLEIGLGHETLAQGVEASATCLSAVMPLGAGIAIPGSGEVGRRFGLGVCLDHSGVKLSQGTEWGWSMVSLGAGCRLTPYACAGLASKYLLSSSDLEGTRVRAYAADIGAALELTPRVTVGVTVANLVGNAVWDDGESESPPLLVSFGGGCMLGYGISGEVSVTLSNSNPAEGGMGVEVPMGTTGLSLRAGYVYCSGDYSRNVVTAGFGYCYGAFGLDYGVKVDDDLALGTTHHFSLGYTLQTGS
jgi:hypothetical protein